MKKGIVGFIIGVLCVCLAGVCFYAGMKYAQKDDDKEPKTEEKAKKEDKKKDEEKKEEKKEGKEKEEDLDSDLIAKAGNYFTSIGCNEYGYRFDGKSRKVSEFTDKEKLYMLISMISFETDYDDLDDDYQIEVDEKEFSKYFEDLSFLSLVKKNGSYGMMWAGLKYEKGKYYYYLNITGCIDDEGGYYVYPYYDAKRLGDKIYVYHASVYYDAKFVGEDDNTFKYSVYKHKGDKKPVYTYSQAEEKSLEDFDLSAFDKYEIVVDTSDGNFRIEAINFLPGK